MRWHRNNCAIKKANVCCLLYCLCIVLVCSWPALYQTNWLNGFVIDTSHCLLKPLTFNITMMVNCPECIILSYYDSSVSDCMQSLAVFNPMCNSSSILSCMQSLAVFQTVCNPWNYFRLYAIPGSISDCMQSLAVFHYICNALQCTILYVIPRSFSHGHLTEAGREIQTELDTRMKREDP